MASRLVFVRGDPLDPGIKDAPSGNNCISMTDARAQEVRQIIQELTDFIDNLALKHDYFDVKLVKLDIGKYSPDNNDSSTGLDLIVDDCNNPSAYDFSGDFVAAGDSDSPTSLDSATQVKKSKYQITHSSRNVTQQTFNEKTTQTVQQTTVDAVDKTYNQYQNQNGYNQDGSNLLNNGPANTDINNNHDQTTDVGSTADATKNNNGYQSNNIGSGANNANQLIRQQFEDNQYNNVIDQQNTGQYNNIVGQQNGGQIQQITGQTQQYRDTTQYTETTNQIQTQNKQYVANTQNTSLNQQYITQNISENNISQNSQEYIDHKTFGQSNHQNSVSKQDNVTYQQNEQFVANDNNQIIKNNYNNQVSPNPRYYNNIETLLLQSLRQLIRSEVQQQFGKDSTNLYTGYDKNTNFDGVNDNNGPSFVNDDRNFNYNRRNPNFGNTNSGYNSPGNANDRNEDVGRVGGIFNKENLNNYYANTEFNKYDKSDRFNRRPNNYNVGNGFGRRNNDNFNGYGNFNTVNDGFNGGSDNYNVGNKFDRETNENFNVYDNPNTLNDSFNDKPSNGNVGNAFRRGTNENFNRYSNYDEINTAYGAQSDIDVEDYTENGNTFSNTAKINDGYDDNSDDYNQQTTQYDSVDDKIVRIGGYSTVNENQVVLYGKNDRDLSRPVVKRINLYNNVILEKKLAEAKIGPSGKSLPLIVHVLDTQGFRQVTIA